MEPPTNWLKMIENIRKVRQKFPAPVDTMGCDQTSDKAAKDTHQRFQVLVSLMLSSQTKDPITWAATQRLKDHGLGNVEGLLKSTEKEIEDLIIPVGFYRRKAIYLKKVAKILAENYGGDIPRSIKDLCDLPGVGPKMAHLCMQEAWDENTGIGVDTHVHRIAARLGWVPNKGIKTPEDTRKALESWLPRDYWREINHLLVGFGQTICRPVGPKCDECFNNIICPNAFSEVSKSKAGKKKPIKVGTSSQDSTTDSLMHTQPINMQSIKIESSIKIEPTIKTEPNLVDQVEEGKVANNPSPKKTRARKAKVEPKNPEAKAKVTKVDPPKRASARIQALKIKEEPTQKDIDHGLGSSLESLVHVKMEPIETA